MIMHQAHNYNLCILRILTFVETVIDVETVIEAGLSKAFAQAAITDIQDDFEAAFENILIEFRRVSL